MFSSNIQNLINTGGQEAAIQRAASLNQRVINIENQLNPEIENNTQTFVDALKKSMNEKYTFRLQNSTTDIKKTAQNSSSVSSSQTVPTSSNYTREQLGNIVSNISAKYNVDEKLVNAVIRQESGFNVKAKSKAGAMGLMQLMPATAKGLGVKDPYNPVQNVEGGVKYLSNLLKKYNGNVILALAAYNAGSGAVDKYNGVPPYKETQNYVKSILANYLG